MHWLDKSSGNSNAVVVRKRIVEVFASGGLASKLERFLVRTVICNVM